MTRPAPELDGEPPRRKHTERQVGESYADALSRVAGERDAALQDVARLQAEVQKLTGQLATIFGSAP